jgi:hypothetical protein
MSPQNWDFLKPSVGRADLSPIMEGAKIQADAVGQMARNIMEGINTGQNRAERKREFDTEEVRRNALADAAQKHYDAEEAHYKATEALQQRQSEHQSAMDAYRAGAPDRMQARTNAVAGAMGIPVAAPVGPNQPGAIDTGGMAPSDIFGLQRAMDEQKRQAVITQKAQYQQAEHQSEVQDATDTFGRGLRGGTLTPQEHAAFVGMAQKDPKGALSKFIDYSAKKADQEHEETYRTDVTSRALKTANEQEKLGNLDAGKDLRAAAASLSHYHGKDLQQKLLGLDEKSQGFALPTDKATPKGSKPAAPKVTTTSGNRVEVSPGLAKGGTFDELRSNPKSMQELTALARGEAQKDPEYKIALQEASVLRSGNGDPAKIQMADNKLDQIVAKHGNALAGQLGWKQGEAKIESPADLKAAIHGGGIDRAKAIEHAKRLGISPADLQKLLEEK